MVVVWSDFGVGVIVVSAVAAAMPAPAAVGAISYSS